MIFIVLTHKHFSPSYAKLLLMGHISSVSTKVNGEKKFQSRTKFIFRDLEKKEKRDEIRVVHDAMVKKITKRGQCLEFLRIFPSELEGLANENQMLLLVIRRR